MTFAYRSYAAACLAVMFCAARAQQMASSPAGIYGFQFAPVEDGTKGSLIVTAVLPGSPAALKKLQTGDQILFVNGVAAGKAGVAELMASQTVDLFILRGHPATVFAIYDLERQAGLTWSSSEGFDELQDSMLDFYLKREKSRHPAGAAAGGSSPQSKASADEAWVRDMAKIRNEGLFQPEVAAPSAPPKQSVWGALLNGIANAAGGSGGLSGRWTGGHTENDPVHGGYLNADWTFMFSPNGTYDETVYVSGQVAMHNTGTYTFAGGSKPGDRTVTNLMSFTPGTPEYPSPEMQRIVASFPMPIGRPVQEYVRVTRYSDKTGMNLQETNLPYVHDWGLNQPH